MSNKLSNIFSQLKSNVVGTKTTNIDIALDKAVKDIVSYKSHSGRNGYINLVRAVIAKSTTNVGFGGSGLYSQGHTDPASFGQGARLMRYRTYEAIVHNINYAHRALTVLNDNILSPDDITKVSLDVKPKSFLEDETPTLSKVKRVREVIKSIKLEQKLEIIVKSTLKLGDFFCELAPPKVALTSRSIISESSNYKQYIQNQISTGTKEIWTETLKGSHKDLNIQLSMDYTSFMESEASSDSKNTLANISLVFHKPNFVIKLQSALFPICFGYLVFPQVKGINTSGNAFEDDSINNICVSILKNLEKKIPQMGEFKDNDELKDIISYMVQRTNPSSALEIRYIPPDKMVHFMIPSTKYYPYGESIYDASQFTAKLLVALETSLTIQRLSRSTEKRKIGIEVGLPRDAKKAVEEMKEAFRKRKVSLDSFGTVDTIPSMITTFEDVYIPQKDGKPFVDISTFNEGSVESRGKVEELKFIRDQLTASWGVPPAFLGLEENLCCDINILIPLLSSETITLKEIIRNYNQGKQMWTYSYDDEFGRIVPGKILWAGYTRMQTKLVRVYLDNDKYIDCTPDHAFMLRDGTYKEAQYLQENESLMPLYRKNGNAVTSGGHSYESVYNPGTNQWQLTYRAIAECLQMVKQGDGKHVHHKDFNPRHNNPENLVGLNKDQHFRIHGSESRESQKLRCVTIIGNCKICNTEFEMIPGSDTVVCSPECKSKYHSITGNMSWKVREADYPVRVVECAYCGKEREFRQKEYNENRFYSCQSNSNCTKYIRWINKATNQGTKLYCEFEYSKCEMCGNPTILSEDKQKILNVCSIKCMNAVLGRRAAEKKKLQSRKKFNCSVCGDEFELAKWQWERLKNDPVCSNQECKSTNYSNLRTEYYKDHWTTEKCIICNEDFKCTHIYKEQTIYPCCDKDECKNEIWYVRNNENKRVAILNHKVVKVEILEGLHDTGDLTIEKYHNFAVDAGVIVHNSAKSTLSEENILFARTVISHQKYLSEQITELLEKVFDLIDPEEALLLFENVDVHLPTPKSLQYEREARYMNELVGLIEGLERIGIPKEYSKKKYLAHFDWQEIKKYDVDEKVAKTLDPSKKDDEMGGMGGMGGMGVGMPTGF